MTHIRNNVLDGAAEIAPRGTRNLGSESLARPPLLALALSGRGCRQRTADVAFAQVMVSPVRSVVHMQ